MKALLKLPVLILAAAFAAYSGFWYYLAYHAEERVQDITADLARSGLEFNYQELAVSGFPYRLVLDFKGVDAGYTDGPLRLDWSGPSLQAVLQPWQLGHAVLLAPDSLISASYQIETTRAVTIESKLLSLSINSADRGGERYSLTLDDARFQPLAGGAAETLVTRTEAHFRSRRMLAAGATVSGLVEPALADFSLSFSGILIDVPGGRDEAIAIDRLAIELTPRGRFFPRLTPYSLAAWRDAGSVVDIARIDGRWGVVNVEGDGSVTLDNDLQPLGAISLRTASPEGLLGKMAETGWIDSRDQQDATAVIQLFRGISAPDAPVALPISLQGGLIAMGPIVLAEIGPLVPR